MSTLARISFCLCLLPLTSALVAAPPSTVSRPSSAATTKMLSDAQIEQDLRARISRSKLATRKFQFRVQGGVATIDGRTDIIQHKGIMTRMAKSAGARAVVNRIEISEAAKRNAADRLESGRRRASVKHQAVAGSK